MSEKASSSPPSSERSAPPPPLPGPGDVIGGKYLVESILGVGGMGVVLAARHLELDEMVAIKMLQPHLPASGESAARFVREAKAAIRIRNEHVVRILDVARMPSGSPYIVMEYLEGRDLGQLVEDRGPLPVEDAVEYVLQACEAIAAAHTLGIVHRDLKPANLFLAKASDGAPCVKVLDFGISKVSDASSAGAPGLTSTATVMGTPCFMSPEQLRSTRDVDARADIWSMGAILHALMAGAPPYDGESNADVSAKIIRDAPTPLRVVRPDVPASLEAVVLRCLQKQPEMRFADVASLAAALAEVVQHDGAKAIAARVTRIAAGTVATAATIRATSDPGAHMIVHLGGSGSEPTRTSSAWGETRREERRKKTIAWGLIAGGVVVGLTAFAGLRFYGGSAHGQPVPSAPGLTTLTASVAAVPPVPSSSASTGPGIGSVATTPSSSPAAFASAVPVASGRPSIPGARPGASAPAQHASAKPASSVAPSSKSTPGLFDGRE